MKVTIREMGNDEPDSVVAGLRIAAYPHFPEVRQTRFYEDLYRWYRSHPAGDQVRRWVAETEAGEVVGHLNAIPQYYRVDGRRVVAHTPGDYMVLPGYGFQAFSLMRRFFRNTENFVACDMVPAVIAVENRLGATVAGELQYAAKLLNVSRLPVPSVPGPLRRTLNLSDQFAPARGYGSPDQTPETGQDAEDEPVLLPMRPRIPLPKPVKSVLNRALGALDEALGKGYGKDGRNKQLEVEEIETFDESFDELFEKVAAVVPCIPEKDSAFLRWRYGPGSPQYPVKVLGVKKGRSLLGYAVLKTLHTGEDGFVLDLTTLPGHREAARALLRETVRYFRKAGAHIIRYRYLSSPASPAPEDLRRLGYFQRKGRRNWLLVRFADRSLNELGSDLDNWSYNVGDGEATFWIR
ncbi:MAG: GNAT family N-acetyltransferase [Rubrobacter sp.]|jgi:hypothetical protein|nr:GNAT family N-acetyltransferase [Rubrobacter sp.]MBA3791255.1 GNAT family N-acetyltransferase [Rubrobacter sp.]